MMCGCIYRNSFIVAVTMSDTTLTTSATHASISELRVWSSRSFQSMAISFLLGYACNDVGRFRPATLRSWWLVTPRP